MDATEVAKILKEFKDVPGTLRKRYICPTCYGSDTCKLDQFPQRGRLSRRMKHVHLHPVGQMAGELAFLGLLAVAASLTWNRLPLIQWPILSAAIISGGFFARNYSKHSLHLRLKEWQQKRDYYNHAWICKRDITVWDPRLNPDGPNSGCFQTHTSNVSLLATSRMNPQGSVEEDFEEFRCEAMGASSKKS